jgi:predicted SAM-dependent methyltransferase
MNRVLLNVGCGQTRPGNWINTDCSLNSLAQRWRLTRKIARRLVKSVAYESSNAEYMNLNRKWPWRENSVDVVYGSHVFEHLTLKSSDFFLTEARRVLKPNGCIRLVVPDLLQLARRYLEEIGEGDPKASHSFLYAMNLHLENTPLAKNRLFRLIHWCQGYPHQHKYMYDSFSLTHRLQSADFVEIRQTGYGQSGYIPEIRDVEFSAEGIPAIYVEAKKRNQETAPAA